MSKNVTMLDDTGPAKPRVRMWGTDKEAERELRRRLDSCFKKQDKLMEQWESNMNSVYGTRDRLDARISFQSHVEALQNNMEYADDVAINYVFTHLRFIHAQMSANPPSVVARPLTSDPEDHRKADGADRLIRFGRRQYKLPEIIDQMNLNALVFGTGCVKTVFDPMLGDIAEFNPDTGEIEMVGDFSFKAPIMLNIFLDSTAKCLEEVRYVFERQYYPKEDALFRWPDKEDLINESVRKSSEGKLHFHDTDDAEIVEVFEYWERGMPQNAMLGRYAVCTRLGKVLESCRPNPFRFSAGGTPAEKRRKSEAALRGEEYTPPPPTAYLPYHFLTDIDVPGSPFGKSFVEYEGPIQDIINKLDSTQLENCKAHGISRLVIPESAEIADDSITNSPWDILKITGSQPPFFMNAPSIFPDAADMRSKLQQGGDAIAGMNDAMLGKLSRETAGFTMQYAVNQGNMVRRRLFNKYTAAVESIFKAFINLVVKHWDEKHLVYVLGAENAFEAADIAGADVDGGYDLVVEYGASLSLDPQTRREEIMTLMPLFEKAGVDTKTLLGMLKLNEIEGMYDANELAANRQREIFEEMIAQNVYIPPRELSDHTGMLAYAYRYVMTSEFKYLDPKYQILVEQHIRERERLVASQAAPTAGAAPGPAPQGPAGVAPETMGMTTPVAPIGIVSG